MSASSNERDRPGTHELVLGVPDYRRVELRDLRSAGGTTGAKVTLNPDGREWLVKHYSGGRDRVASELLANAIYFVN